MPPLREMLSMASPTPSPPKAEGDSSSSDYYFFIVTIAVVTVILVVSNVIAFSCCSSCRLGRALGMLLGAREPSSDELPDGGRVPQGMIPACKYRKEQQGSDAECSVCLSAFAEGEDVRLLPICKHSFHSPCIDMWLYSHSNCPLCRANIAPPPRSRGCQPPPSDTADVVVAIS